MARLPKQFKYIHIIAIAVTSLLYIGIRSYPFYTAGGHAALAKDDSCYVARVVDGDTIMLSNREKVRLIGVDTPEKFYSDKLLRDSKKSGRDIKFIQALGARASEFTRDLCLNKKVRLEYDVESRDRYI